MTGFAGHGRGKGVPFPRHIRDEHRAISLAAHKRRLAARTDRQKTKALGLAMAAAVRRCGAFQLLDGMQAGFTETEIGKFRDDAVAYARRIEPSFDSIIAAHA